MAHPPLNGQICQLLQSQIIDAGVAPAAVAGFTSAQIAANVGAAGALPSAGAAGAARVDARTIFDLASVSKPVVACTLLRLVSRGAVALEAPLGSLVAEARGSATELVPLELLLAHRAGLEAHRSLFAPLFEGRALRRERALRVASEARRPECAGTPPLEGFPPVYSDLGYLLLGAAIEAVADEALDVVVQREVAEPLGLALGSARQLRRRRPTFDDDVAPTEVVRARGGALRGVVHDENAWALSGHACSGHAGLFGSVLDVLGFGQALLEALAGRSTWLPSAAVQLMVRPRPGGTLRAGFDGKSAGLGSDGRASVSSAGTSASLDTFGHLGFTGTSLWCDPRAGIATALLTNRVYPTRDNARIRAARPVMHEALFVAAKPVLPGPPNP